MSKFEVVVNGAAVAEFGTRAEAENYARGWEDADSENMLRDRVEIEEEDE